MKVKSIIPAGKCDAFNMEVDGTHDFAIQGGVIVHNCADEARYMCMSRPIKPRMSPAKDKYYESPLYTALDIKKEDLTTVKRRERTQIITKGE